MPQATSGAAATPEIVGQGLSMLKLQAMQQRREIIAEQYQNTIAERGRIGQERLNAQARGDLDMVREYDGTIARIGARLKTLEEKLADADRQIDEAMQAPVAVEGEPISTANPGPAIAIEVERLSEGQRFINNLMATRRPERETLPARPVSTPSDGSRVTPH